MREYLRFMRSTTAKFRNKLSAVLLLSIIIYSIAIVTSMVGGLLIDSIREFDLSSIFMIVGLSTSLFLVGGLIGYFTNVLQANLVNSIKNKMRLDFYDQVQRLDYQIIDKTSFSEIYQRMFQDISIVLDFYLLLIISFPINILVLVGVLVVMFTISTELAIFLIIFGIVQSVLIWAFKKPIRRATKNRIDTDQNLVRRVNEDFQKNELTRSLGLEEVRLREMANSLEAAKTNIVKQVSLNSIISNVLGFSGQAMTFITLLFGVYLIFMNRLTLGELFFLFSISGLFSRSLTVVIESFPNYLGVRIHYNRYKDMIAKTDKNRSYFSVNAFPDFRSLWIEGISFSYGKIKIFDNEHLELKNDSLVLLKGKNGSGKTTLLKMIGRFLYPVSGNINLGDINISDIEYECYKENVTLMLNNDYLIEDTLMNNVTMGNGYCEEKLKYVFELCGLDNIASKLELGYDTLVGLKFKNLSSGEKRRISLARSLIRTPKILLLDEPTAHINYEDIVPITRAIKEFHRMYPCLLVISSHDKIMEDIADQIINL